MKKRVIFFSFMLIIVLIPSVVLAFASDVISDPTPSVDPEISSMTKEIIEVIKYIGYAISTAMLMFIGNKYIMSSANEKADMKQAIINCVIGSALITSTVTILDICVDLMDPSKDAPAIIEDGEATAPNKNWEGFMNTNNIDTNKLNNTLLNGADTLFNGDN